MIHPHRSGGDRFIVNKAAFSPDGKAVLSLFEDRTAARLVDRRTCT